MRAQVPAKQTRQYQLTLLRFDDDDDDAGGCLIHAGLTGAMEGAMLAAARGTTAESAVLLLAVTVETAVAAVAVGVVVVWVVVTVVATVVATVVGMAVSATVVTTVVAVAAWGGLVGLSMAMAWVATAAAADPPLVANPSHYLWSLDGIPHSCWLLQQ
jgi:hypothetical protein